MVVIVNGHEQETMEAKAKNVFEALEIVAIIAGLVASRLVVALLAVTGSLKKNKSYLQGVVAEVPQASAGDDTVKQAVVGRSC